MQVACFQLAYPTEESKPERVRRVLSILERVADADLVVLPELWPTGYFSFDRYDDEAEPLDGETVTELRKAASRLGTHLMGGTFVERLDDGGLANCAILIDPNGDVIHTYRKVHLFGYESREAELLTPGEEISVGRSDLGPIGMTTCYDLRFPELYRLLTDQGAELIVIPAAWPKARLDHWSLLLRARAIEDQTFVIGCNGAGEQGGTALGGHSVVIDPWGEVLAEAGDDEQLLHAEIDLTDVTEVRAEFPVLEHRRLTVNRELTAR